MFQPNKHGVDTPPPHGKCPSVCYSLSSLPSWVYPFAASSVLCLAGSIRLLQLQFFAQLVLSVCCIFSSLPSWFFPFAAASVPLPSWLNPFVAASVPCLAGSIRLLQLQFVAQLAQSVCCTPVRAQLAQSVCCTPVRSQLAQSVCCSFHSLPSWFNLFAVCCFQ